MNEEKTDEESDKHDNEVDNKQPSEDTLSIRHNSDAGEVKPSDEQLLDLVKQYRTPPESYAAARKTYGPGHAVRMKQLAVKSGLWKRKRKESTPSPAPATSASSEYAASDTTATSQNPTRSGIRHDSMAYAPSNVNVGDSEPSEHLKAFNAAFTASKRAGLSVDTIALAKMLGYDDVVALLQGSPGVHTIQAGGMPSSGGTVPQHQSNDWDIMGDVGNMMRLAMRMKLAAPMIQMISNAMGGFGGSAGAGNSEIQALKEQIEKQEHDKVMDSLRDEIQSLKEKAEKGQDPAAAATVKMLEFQLQSQGN